MTTSIYKTWPNQTISNTEFSLVNGSTSLAADATPGVYQLFIDGLTNLVKGDEFLVKIKEKTCSGGTQIIYQQFRLKGTQSQGQASLAWMFAIGWDMTIIRASASDRALNFTIRKA